jgi:hypothetical protein
MIKEILNLIRKRTICNIVTTNFENRGNLKWGLKFQTFRFFSLNGVDAICSRLPKALAGNQGWQPVTKYKEKVIYVNKSKN